MKVRIQRQRTKGWRMPPNTVYVGRPSRWGNPERAEDEFRWEPSMRRFEPSPQRLVDRFWWFAHLRAKKDPDWLAPLVGHDLACWCPLDQPCHADVLLELASPSLNDGLYRD